MMFGHWFPPHVFRSSEFGTGSQFDIRISQSVPFFKLFYVADLSFKLYCCYIFKMSFMLYM